MKQGLIYIFLFLCLAFVIFSFSVYIKPAALNNNPVNYDIKKSSEGVLVWQKYNCQCCHQLYGLGGYLGPDLTNIYSAPGKGEILIKAMIMSGTSQMPVFNLSETEMGQLIEFLKATDASGSADPRNFIIQYNGMITHK